MLLCIVLPGFAIAATPLPEARPESQGISSARLQRLHDYMRTATGDDGYLGGVTLLARNGRIVDWRPYGHRDFARREPMRKDSIFRIYSMTKTVTSVAVMMLVEEGKLTLEDPLSRYPPGFAAPQVLVGGSGSTRAAANRRQVRPVRLLILHAGRRRREGRLSRRCRREAHRPACAADLRGFAERMKLVRRGDPDPLRL